MIFEPKTVPLKDGRTCLLRPVRTEDATAMTDDLRTVAAETPFLLRYEDEITFTVEKEAALLQSKREHPREVMMTAEVAGVLAGNCSIVSKGELSRVRHRCGLGIALKRPIGTWASARP